ncbi:MAG: F0F1 ATP synthase subunit A [Chthoniobacterales bacterium]|nr:F0F1 ATP synthase subunit A [Chthoniobacterales bacterium]
MSFHPIIAAILSLHAPHLFAADDGVSFLSWLTNSIFVSIFISAFVIWLCRRATRKLLIVPSPLQNGFELVVESLYTMLEEIVGKHMIARTFSFFATLFIFILASNWFGLLPGVGSIGWGEHPPGRFLSLPHVDTPLLRPTTADLNMTLAMALVFMVLWLYWSLSEVGLKNFLTHMFGVKGGLKGFMALALAPIFFFVGIIEVISILFRPVSLSLRLYGNVFAGENLLSSMITLGHELGLPRWMAALASITIPIPFYFLELLVGVLQALVFMLLCAVYIQLATSHDEEEEH